MDMNIKIPFPLLLIEESNARKVKRALMDIIEEKNIDTVVFNNYKLYVTVQLLCKLSQNNVCIIVCEKNGLPELTASPITGNFSAFKQQELQLNFDTGNKKILWQLIIKRKF